MRADLFVLLALITSQSLAGALRAINSENSLGFGPVFFRVSMLFAQLGIWWVRLSEANLIVKAAKPCPRKLLL